MIAKVQDQIHEKISSSQILEALERVFLVQLKNTKADVMGMSALENKIVQGLKVDQIVDNVTIDTREPVQCNPESMKDDSHSMLTLGEEADLENMNNQSYIYRTLR